MKYTIFALGVLVIACSAIFNTTTQIFFKGTPYTIPPFVKDEEYISKEYKAFHKINGFALNNNNVEVYSQSLRYGVIATEGFFNGNKYSPIIHVNSFDLNSGASALTTYPIHISDFTGKDKSYDVREATNMKQVGSSKTDSHLKDLKNKFPGAFPILSNSISKKGESYLEVVPKLSSFEVQSVTPVTILDSLYIAGKWSYTKITSSLNIDLPKFQGDYKTVLWAEDQVYNKQENLLTYVVGADRKELKKQHYKEFSYTTVGIGSAVFNQHIAKFDHTKAHWYYDLAYNLNNNHKQLVAVLGDRAFMGKHNHPIDNTFNILVFDESGSFRFSKEFNCGEKKGAFHPLASFIKNDKVYLLSLNNVNPGVDFFIFDSEGNMTVQSLGSKELWAMTYSNISGSSNLGLSFLANKPSYKPIGLHTLGNGNKLLLLEAKNGKYVNTPNPNTLSGVEMVYQEHYQSLIGLEISNDMKIVGQYIVNKQFTNDSAPTTIEDIIISDNKLVLLTVDKILPTKNFAKQDFLNLSEYLAVGCEAQCKPVVMVMDFQNKKVLTETASEPTFVTLYGTGSYVLKKESKEIIYVGMKEGLPPNQVEIQACKFDY